MLVNVLCILIGTAYCYRRQGFAAGLTYAVFLSTSYVYLRYSNEAYPDIDMSLHTLLAGVFLMSGFRRNVLVSATTLAGVFTVFAAISKPSALATIAVVILFLFTRRRDWRSFLLGLLFGALAAGAICLLAFDFETIARFAQGFGDRVSYVLEAMTFGREGIDVSAYDALVSQRYFPLLIGLLALGSFWRDPEVRFWFVLGLGHILLLGIIVGLSQTIRADKPIYYHTACTCACVGLSLGLGRIIREWDERRGVIQKLGYKIGSRLGGILLVLLSLLSLWFTAKAGRYAASPTGEETPGWFRTVFAIVPVGLLILLLIVGVRRSVAAAFLLLLGVTLWQPFLSFNAALPAIQRDQAVRAIMHEGARHFNDAEAAPVGVLIERFGRYANSYVKGMEMEYAVYFDDGRFSDDPPRTVLLHPGIQESIRCLTEPAQADGVGYVIVDSRGFERIKADGPGVETVSEWMCARDTFRVLKVLKE
jgi:hypothetical protein